MHSKASEGGLRLVFPVVDTNDGREREGVDARLETISGRVHLELTNRQFAMQDLTM